MTVAFLVTTLVVVATPGTGAVYTIGAGSPAAVGRASSRRSGALSASSRT